MLFNRNGKYIHTYINTWKWTYGPQNNQWKYGILNSNIFLRYGVILINICPIINKFYLKILKISSGIENVWLCLAIYLSISWESNIFLFSIFLYLAWKMDVVLPTWTMISSRELKTKTIDFFFYSFCVLKNKYFIISLIVYWLSATKR